MEQEAWRNPVLAVRLQMMLRCGQPAAGLLALQVVLLVLFGILTRYAEPAIRDPKSEDTAIADYYSSKYGLQLRTVLLY